MNPDVSEVVESLNRSRLHADAWIVWRVTADADFELVAAGGLGEQASQDFVANWTGNDNLLHQAFRAVEPARATAEVTTSNGQSLPLHLVGLPFASSQGVVGILECLYRQAEPAERIFRSGLTEAEQNQLVFPSPQAQGISAKQADLARSLEEIVAETSGAQRLTSLLNEFCLRYGLDRAVLVEGTGDRSVLRGQSGTVHREERAEQVRELRQLARDHVQERKSPWFEVPADRSSGQMAAVVQLRRRTTEYAAMFLLLERFEQAELADSQSSILEELPVWSLAFQAAAAGPGRDAMSRYTGMPLSLLVACGLAILLVIPIPLTIQADGQFWPALRANVYAPEAGVVAVDQLNLPADRLVQMDQPLLTITSRELELELSQLDGQLATVNEQIRSLRNTRPERSSAEDNQRSAERDVSIRLAELLARQQGLQDERALLLQRLESLTVLSPLTGQILTWDPELKLAGRPVSRGQELLSIGQADGGWEVLADVSDEDLGLFKMALEKQGGAVQLRTRADGPQMFEGTLTQLAKALHTVETGRLAARAEIELKDNVPGLLPGQRVQVRVNAGYYPAGYVWFRQAIEAIRAHLTW